MFKLNANRCYDPDCPEEICFNPKHYNYICFNPDCDEIHCTDEKHYDKYAQEFGKTILGFFSDEPMVGNIAGGYQTAKLGGQKPLTNPWQKDMPDLLRNFPVRFQAPQHLPRGLGFRNNLRQRKGDRKRAQNCCSTSGGLTGIHLQISKGDIPPFQHTADIVQERAIYHELALPCIQPHDLSNLTGNIRHLFVMVLHLRADQVHGIAEGRHNISFCSKLLNHFITSSIIFFL